MHKSNKLKNNKVLKSKKFEEKIEIPRRLKFLLMLILYSNKNKFTIPEIENYLGYTHAQPDIRELIKYLISLNIIEEAGEYYHKKLFIINNSKLRIFVYQSENFKLIYKIIDSDKTKTIIGF